MSDTSNEIETRLRTIGLTKYEIKAYLGLLNHGDLSADELKEITDIPLARIYDTMDQLSTMGLINILAGRPRKFRVVVPQLAFTQLQQSKKEETNTKLEEFNANCSKISTLIEGIYLERHTQLSPDELLEPFFSLEEAEIHTKEMVETAKKEIFIFSRLFYWYDIVEDTLNEKIKNGVSVKIIMQESNDPKANKILDKLRKNDIEVRVVPEDATLVRGTIIDNKQALFVIWASSPQENTKKVYRPLYSENLGIIQIISNNFKWLWNLKHE
ncbi:MAG: TrmB family transcriptional regulator [Candidatus Heimdallarchaeota archaeon]|nr:TrmB family transcriptional regulator [Candidatus Heimdallarchaeota archaeon]MCK5047932.1 TrmB family transcriptional regulator [Candidatus Heimdallarchaeota archaeon]